MKVWLREPLVHFLGLGALLFILNGVFGNPAPADSTITVSEPEIGRLVQLFAAQWQRPPTREELDGLVEQSLRNAALWDEVKDRLDALGSLLSGGQQQRLTIARALSQEPDLLLLDEFSIAVDPVTTMKIEDVLRELKEEMTIVLVTNLVQQARRLASRTAFFLMGECVEVGDTEAMFGGVVEDERTQHYLEGRFG